MFGFCLVVAAEKEEENAVKPLIAERFQLIQQRVELVERHEEMKAKIETRL